MRRKARFGLKSLFVAPMLAAFLLLLATLPASIHTLILTALTLVSLLALPVGLFLRRMPAGQFLIRAASVVILCVTGLFLSFGPASWAFVRFNTPDTNNPWSQAFSAVYVPVATCIIFAPRPIRAVGMKYVAAWMPDGTRFHDDWDTGLGWTTDFSPTKFYTYTVIHY